MHLPRSAEDPPAPTVAFDDFLALDIRVGTITRVEPFPEARKPESLIGRQVGAVVNFPPRQIGRFLSEVLTLGFPDAQGRVVLFSPDAPVPNGARLF